MRCIDGWMGAILIFFCFASSLLCLPTAISANTTDSALWTAGMEEGTLDEWYAYDCGAMYNTLGGNSVASRARAHSGKWSAKMTISATTVGGQTSATRLYRWCEQKRNRELYYSGWYYFPRRHTLSLYGWLSLAQWKGVTWDRKRNAPFFILGVGNVRPGAMNLNLTWWSGLKIEGPQPGQSGGRAWNSPLTIPVGRWFHVEIRHVCAADFTGTVQVWQDGVEIFNLEGVRTRYENGDCQWAVNNYGERVLPSPVVIYVDDLAISESRVGP